MIRKVVVHVAGNTKIKLVQELQEINQKQTAIIRDLSAQQENAAAEMRADLEAEKDRLAKKVQLDIAFNRKQREEQEVCFLFFLPLHSPEDLSLQMR